MNRGKKRNLSLGSGLDGGKIGFPSGCQFCTPVGATLQQADFLGLGHPSIRRKRRAGPLKFKSPRILWVINVELELQ